MERPDGVGEVPEADVPFVRSVEYWRERLKNADLRGRLHTSVYDVPEGKWEAMNAVHRNALLSVLQPYSSVLDVGCGYGSLLDVMPAFWKGKYLGIDISPDFINRAKLLNPKFEFKVADARTYEAPNRYDYCIARIVHGVTSRHDPDGWTAILNRMLKNGVRTLLLHDTTWELLR